MAFPILVDEYFPLGYGLDRRSNSRFSGLGGVLGGVMKFIFGM